MARKKSGANRGLYLGQHDGAGGIPTSSLVAMYLRNVSDSLDGVTETIKSGELLPGRSTAEPMQGSSSSAGAVFFEFSSLSFDRLLAGALMSNWVQNETDPKISTLQAGGIARRFWILKKFAEADYPLYQLYRKLMVDSFDLSYVVNAISTGSFGFLGVNNPLMETVNPVTGLAVLPAPLKTQAFTSRKGYLKIDSTSFRYAKEVKLNVKNNLALLPALFELEPDMVEKEFAVTGSISAYLTDGIFHNLAINGTKITLGIEVEDETSAKYLVEFSNVKLESASSAVGGKDEIAPSYNFTAFGSDVIKITRTLSIAVPVYTLTFDGNAATTGTAPAPVLKLEAGSIVFAPENTGVLVKTGKVFSGWNSLALGTGTDYPVGTPVVVEGAMSLFAKWV